MGVLHRINLGLILILGLLTNAQAQTRITAMTYNIRLDVASDGENAWPKRRDYLADQIQFYAPDVFGIQEGLPHQVDFLKQKLKAYSSTGIGREGVGKGESCHVFFKKAQFSLLKTHTFWLSPTPDSISMGWDAACLRVCTGVLLQEKRSKKRFWVFNTHLDHVGETARLNSVQLILSTISSLNSTKLPVIFMGDLNAEPNTALISRLKTELVDCRERAEVPPFGPEGTFNGFEHAQPVTRLIDYVFVSKNPNLQVKKYGVLSDSKNLRYPSDHLPVFVEILMW